MAGKVTTEDRIIQDMIPGVFGGVGRCTAVAAAAAGSNSNGGGGCGEVDCGSCGCYFSDTTQKIQAVENLYLYLNFVAQ